MVGWAVDNELEKIWEEMAVALARNYFAICLERLKKTSKNSLRTADVPAEIPTEHFPN
jgi:hypothetical protein